MPSTLARVCMAVVAALATSALVASPASAAPLAQQEYVAQVTAAVNDSGLYAPGTTFSAVVALSDGGFTITGSTAANPDGSMSSSGAIGAAGLRSNVKCVRVDRCWALNRSTYKDRKWHLLPKGAVTYVPASTLTDALTEGPWTDATTFDVADTPAGGKQFTVVSAAPDATQTLVVDVSPSNLVFRTWKTATDGTRSQEGTVTATSSTTRLIVTAPARATVGRPDSTDATSVDAPINPP